MGCEILTFSTASKITTSRRTDTPARSHLHHPVMFPLSPELPHCCDLPPTRAVFQHRLPGQRHPQLHHSRLAEACHLPSWPFIPEEELSIAQRLLDLGVRTLGCPRLLPGMHTEEGQRKGHGGGGEWGGLCLECVQRESPEHLTEWGNRTCSPSSMSL